MRHVLIAHVPYQSRGGEDHHVDALIKAYARIGWQTTLLPSNRTPAPLSLSRSLNSLKRGGDGHSNYSLIHIHNLYPELGPRFLRQVAHPKTPTIMTVHNHRFYCTNGLALRNSLVCKICLHQPSLLRPILNNCNGDLKKSAYYATAIHQIRRDDLLKKAIDLFVAPSPYIAAELQSAGYAAEKIQVLFNPVEAGALVRTNQAPEFDFFYAGRLSQEKGIGALLTAIQLRPDLRFAIAGHGPMLEAVERVQSQGKNLKFLGTLTADQVRQTLLRSRAGVLPSICNEILPTFILECAVSGTRYGVPDLDSTRWLGQKPYFGLALPTQDGAKLAQALSRVLALPEPTDLEITSVRESFGFAKFCQGLDQITRRVTRSR